MTIKKQKKKEEGKFSFQKYQKDALKVTAVRYKFLAKYWYVTVAAILIILVFFLYLASKI